MSRRQFGGTPGDFVAGVGPGGVLEVTRATVTFWTMQTAGTRLTDLLDGTGTPTTSMTTDNSGQLGVFQGPADDTAAMWADAGGSSRQLMLATDFQQTQQLAQLVLRALAGQTADPLTVFDSAGAPIGGIPLAGGMYVSGDNLRVFAPGDLFNPVVEAYGSTASPGSLRFAKGDLAGGVGVLGMGDCTTPPSAQPDGSNVVEGADPVAGSVLFSRSGRIYGLPGSGAVEEVGLPTLRRVARIQSVIGGTTVDSSGIAAPSLSGTAANADNPLLCGAVSLTTAASIGATAGVVPASFGQCYGAWQPMFWTRIVTGATLTSVRLWAGMFSADPSAVSSPTGIHVAGFRYDTAVDGTTWRCVTSAASGSPTVATSGTTVAASTMYDLRVEWNHTNSKIRFLINDVVVAIVTATMPTYNQGLAPGVWVTALAASARVVSFSRLVLTHAG